MREVVVIGAGPIGLATAILLSREGLRVTVLDKDRDAAMTTPEAVWGTVERRGVAQYRQPHFMMPRFRQVLDEELPEVRSGIERLGGRWLNLVDLLPATLPDRSRRPGDERFEALTARRPVLETALAQVAEGMAEVRIRRGVAVEGPLAAPGGNGDPPHVSGVRTADGEELRADLVVDAMGRRSKYSDWVVAIGGRRPFEEASDAGFAYYTRHFSMGSRSVPDYRGPIATDVATLRVLTLIGDNDCWQVALIPLAGDVPFKALRHQEAWQKVVRAIPHAAHWLDGEPLSDVLPMAGVMDRYRRSIVDGAPVVTGMIPVGDAWACTNPTAGRGFSLGIPHAVALRNVVREVGDDPDRLVRRFDEVTEATLTPWYRDQIERDRQRAAAFRSAVQGEPPAPPSPAQQMQMAFFAAAGADPDVARGLFDTLCCLALPAAVMTRPGIAERVASFIGAKPPDSTGPTRAELLALLN